MFVSFKHVRFPKHLYGPKPQIDVFFIFLPVLGTVYSTSSRSGLNSSGFEKMSSLTSKTQRCAATSAHRGTKGSFGC